MATPKNKTAVDEATAKEAEAIAAAEAAKEAAEKAAAEAEAAKKQPIKALQVVAKVDSFRRGGIVFGRTETTVRLDELTTEQIKQIKGEPLLAVTEIEVAAE